MFGIDSLSDIANVAARLATAYATGGMSEVMRLATDIGTQVIGQVLADQGIELPSVVETALSSYVEGLTQGVTA
jgi:hypothetical protein